MFDFLQKLKIIEILGKILILLRTINGSGPCYEDECTFEWTLKSMSQIESQKNKKI